MVLKWKNVLNFGIFWGWLDLVDERLGEGVMLDFIYLIFNVDGVYVMVYVILMFNFKLLKSGYY